MPRPDDAAALGAIHVRAWQAAYRGGLMPDEYLDALSVEERTQMWREVLGREPAPGGARFVAEDPDGRVVGFIVVGPATGDTGAGVGEVHALNVDPDVWGSGYGGALLEAGVAHLLGEGFVTAVLWVHPGNERACGFYRAHGWRDTGERRRDEVLGVEVSEARYRRSLAPG